MAPLVPDLHRVVGLRAGASAGLGWQVDAIPRAVRRASSAQPFPALIGERGCVVRQHAICRSSDMFPSGSRVAERANSAGCVCLPWRGPPFFPFPRTRQRRPKLPSPAARSIDLHGLRPVLLPLPSAIPRAVVSAKNIGAGKP